MSKYHVGFGITVEIEGEIVRVGSRRFLAMERISIPAELEPDLARMHAEGNSFVTVAVGDHLAGVLELRSSHRPEAEAIVGRLRAHGVKHLVIISGDHEAPTRRLSEQLGIATDTAQIVFLEESLAKICTLMEVSHALENNVRRSWHLILLPNTLCVAGVLSTRQVIDYSVERPFDLSVEGVASNAPPGGPKRQGVEMTYIATGFSNPVRVIFQAIFRPTVVENTCETVAEHFGRRFAGSGKKFTSWIASCCSRPAGRRCALRPGSQRCTAAS